MNATKNSRSLQKFQANAPGLATPGLVILGLTIGLVSLQDAGLFPLAPGVLAVLLLCGGVGQLFMAVMEKKGGNYFGTTVFASYGLCWFSLIALTVFPGAGWALAPQPLALSTYLALWGVFSVLLFSGTARIGLSLRIIFGLMVAYFFLTAMGVAIESPVVRMIAGYEGIVCGLSTISLALLPAAQRRDPGSGRKT